MVHVHPFVPMSRFYPSSSNETPTLGRHGNLHEELGVHVQQASVHRPLPRLLQDVCIDVLQQRECQRAVHRVSVVGLRVRVGGGSHIIEHGRGERAAAESDAGHEDVVEVGKTLEGLLAQIKTWGEWGVRDRTIVGGRRRRRARS